MCSNEVDEFSPALFYNPYIPSKVGDATILMEKHGKIYVCVCCGQTIEDCFREQYTKEYNSFMATYTLSRAFEYAAVPIKLVFDTGYFRSNGSPEWIEQVGKDEKIVKALECNVEDAEYKFALEIVERCKKLAIMVREWPSKKEDVKYFIDSMKNIVAILELLQESDVYVSRIKESFCENNIVTGWHRPYEI